MHHMNIDLETFSSVNIKKSGMYKYVQSPDFEILLFGYAIDFGEVKVLDLSGGVGIPPEIGSMLMDRDYVKHAYNAAFEWYGISKYLFGSCEGAKINWLPQWHCTMLHGLYCGYPGGLGAVGKALELPDDKLKATTGKALIRVFCNPHEPTSRNGNRRRTLPHHEPEKWELFKQYNVQDVVTEMEVLRRLSPFPVPEDIQRQWCADITMAARGVSVDMDLVTGALACSDTVTAELTTEAEHITRLDNPNSPAQLKGWLESKTGQPLDALDKAAVSDMLDTELPPDARRMLEIRQELGKTSVKKFTAMENAVCTDGRIRGMLQFYGANRSGRWAGRMVQLQNLPQTHIRQIDGARSIIKKRDAELLRGLYGSVPDTLSQLIRTALIPSSDHIFIDADFSAIEARVTAWFAGEEWVLNVFRGDGRIYEATAANMFGVDVNLIRKGNPEYALRQKGKVATLALGYGGGAGALINMGALKMGIAEEELPELVQLWRTANPNIKRLWYSVENAAIECVRSGQQTGTHGLIFAMEGDRSTNQWFLTIRLPSGRKLYYARPTIEPGKFDNDALFYGGLNVNHQWSRITTWGGKLVENIVQATARDCLEVALHRLEDAGYDVVFHIHDEIVADVPDLHNGEKELAKIVQIMTQPISWAPGLPLGADGWVGNYFKKD